MTKKDIEQLSKLISQKLGYHISFTNVSDKPERIKLVSQDIKEFAGVQSKIYKSLVVATFNSGLVDSGMYWMTLAFSFEYVFGGSNGAELCTVWFDYNKNEFTVKYNF